MEKYQQKIVEILKEELPGYEIIVTVPPAPEMGDIAVPCFSFAKEMRKSPVEIASSLKNKFNNVDFIDRVEVHGGYLNFFVSKSVLVKDTITEILTKKELYGSSMSGAGKKALVEHTSINPNASPHVGRARNALIGDAIVRLLRFEGYQVDVHYFVNDIGKQIAMLLLGAREEEDITFKDLLNIYIEINNRVEENPDLEKEVFDLLYKLENGDQQTIDSFRKIVNICVEGQSKILNELGIKYDYYDYESDYVWNNKTEEVLEELRKTGNLFEDSDGRYVLNLEKFNLPYLVVTRGDKTSLYPLRDIAYTIDKAKTNSDRNIIVLGEDQKLYFQQVKAAVNMLGYQAPEVVHYSFVLLKDGKMSTRKGTVVLLEDFMKEAVLKAEEEMAKRHQTVDKKVAQSIAYGAVKYAILKTSNERNVIFDWDSALSFDGDSSPYIQYSYARICSIFRKYGKEVSDDVNLALLKEEEEIELVKELAGFPGVIKRTLKELSPHIIANYLYEVTKKFSRFYHNCPVLNAENQEVLEARLALIKAVSYVIKNGLNLLGIDVVESM